MGKKPDPEGAPAYMALYTSLMTLLLAFFILLNSMASVQHAGFRDGIGQVKNAFGVKGGLGLNQFVTFIRDVNPFPGDENTGITGMTQKSMTGKGGVGTTDQKVEKTPKAKYLVLQIPGKFEDESSSIPPKMLEYLAKTGLPFSMFDYKVNIRCYSDSTGNNETDSMLALNRALNIKNYLRRRWRIAEKRLEAIGYSDLRYFPRNKKLRRRLRQDEQATFFYIFQTVKKNDKTS